MLQEVASECNRTITYAELKERVTTTTHRSSDQHVNTWSSRVLNPTIRICEAGGHPRLMSLVVRASDGGVGEGFRGALHSFGRDRIEDPQQLEVVAAEERLGATGGSAWTYLRMSNPI